MKRTPLEKLGDFVLGKGFYIVLSLCVLTVGISGYYLIRAAVPTPEPVTGNPTVTVPDKSIAAPRRPAPTPAPAVRPKPPRQVPEPPAKPQPPQRPDTAPAVYTWPVKGEILRGFSLEVLAFDETMGDWRTHSGVDIAAGEGIKVLAVSDGQVAEVFHDDLMGTTVVIDHGDALSSVYCNLGENPTVEPGDAVSTGTVIGVVGNTAIAEAGCPPHLHLEMLKEGRAVDPVDYFPKLGA